MKILLTIGKLLDFAISLTLHVDAIILLFQQQVVSAAIVFGMVSLWQIACHGIKHYPQAPAAIEQPSKDPPNSKDL